MTGISTQDGSIADVRRLKQIAESALGRAEMAFDAVRTRPAPDTQALVQSRRMVLRLRDVILAGRDRAFTDNFSDLCETADMLSPEEILSGLTRVLDKLAGTVQLGACATGANPTWDQYLAWEWTMHAMEAVVRQYRLVSERHIARHFELPPVPPRPPWR